MPGKRTAAYWFASGFGLIVAVFIAVLFIGVPAVTGLSAYFAWHRGYGLGCTSETIAETTAPSGQWTARVRHLMCSGPTGGLFLDVALIPSSQLPWLNRYRVVFSRDVTYAAPDLDSMIVQWIDDGSIALHTAGCKSWECDLVESTDGIRISMVTAAP